MASHELKCEFVYLCDFYPTAHWHAIASDSHSESLSMVANVEVHLLGLTRTALDCDILS